MVSDFCAFSFNQVGIGVIQTIEVKSLNETTGCHQRTDAIEEKGDGSVARRLDLGLAHAMRGDHRHRLEIEAMRAAAKDLDEMISSWGATEDELMEEYKQIRQAARQKKRNVK